MGKGSIQRTGCLQKSLERPEEKILTGVPGVTPKNKRKWNRLARKPRLCHDRITGGHRAVCKQPAGAVRESGSHQRRCRTGLDITTSVQPLWPLPLPLCTRNGSRTLASPRPRPLDSRNGQHTRKAAPSSLLPAPFRHRASCWRQFFLSRNPMCKKVWTVPPRSPNSALQGDARKKGTAVPDAEGLRVTVTSSETERAAHLGRCPGHTATRGCSCSRWSHLLRDLSAPFLCRRGSFSDSKNCMSSVLFPQQRDAFLTHLHTPL